MTRLGRMKNSLSHSKVDRWRWSFAALVLAVQACGGGGDGGTGNPGSAFSNGAPAAEVPPAPAPAPQPAPVPVAVAPAPAPAPVPAPAPAPVVSPSPAPTPVVTAPDASTSSTLIQASAATTCSIPGLRETLLAEINAVRTAGRVCGSEIMPAVAPVTWNDILFSAAARHSTDMAVRDYFSHTTPDGVSFGQRLYNEGYYARAGGENIAAGQGTATGVMSSWLNSSGHCRNIMQPAFSEVAVACVRQDGSMYGTYWTMDLGAR